MPRVVTILEQIFTKRLLQQLAFTLRCKVKQLGFNLQIAKYGYHSQTSASTLTFRYGIKTTGASSRSIKIFFTWVYAFRIFQRLATDTRLLIATEWSFFRQLVAYSPTCDPFPTVRANSKRSIEINESRLRHPGHIHASLARATTCLRCGI